MKVFDFDPEDHRELYERQGWVHIPNGIDPEFLALLTDFAERSFGSHVVEGKGIGGTKQQSLYEFPEGVDFPGHLFDVIASLCGLQRATMTLSERHIKAYDDDAPAEPAAHKDRLSSQVSVGLSIDIPQDSRLVLYPDSNREPNMFNVSAALRESLADDELPEVALLDAPEVVLDDQAGDVVVFPGSSMWHLRRNAARAVNLYLKFNDFNSDPLGEDPATPVRREGTLASLEEASLTAFVPVPSRRLDTITRQHTRDGWRDIVQAMVWDSKPVTLSDPQVELLRSLDGSTRVGELTANGLGRDAIEAEVRRLAERGVVDLVSST